MKLQNGTKIVFWILLIVLNIFLMKILFEAYTYVTNDWWHVTYNINYINT